jgi:hypothetical protein
MATNQVVNRRQLSPEERVVRDAAYRVDARGFGDVLDVLITNFQTLMVLNAALSSAGQGQSLGWRIEGANGQVQFLTFNRRHLRSAAADFAGRLKQLKKYFSISMRREKKKPNPESFSGVYAPVYAGEALRQFFNEGALANGVGFGPAQPGAVGGELLMDLLPNAKQGWLLRNTTTLLFFAYAHAQGLQDQNDGRKTRSDPVMDRAFNGTIIAAAYPNIVGQKMVEGKAGAAARQKNLTQAIPMSDAVARGLTAPLNTYQGLQQAYPEFNPGRFDTYFFQNLAAYNYYTSKMLAAPNVVVDPVYSAAGVSANGNSNLPDAQLVANTLASIRDRRGTVDPDPLGQAMLREHDVASAASAGWRAINEPKQKQQRADRKREKDAAGRGQGGRRRQPRGAGIVQLPPLNR